MSHHAPRLEDLVMTRRELLSRSGMGMGALALGQPAGRDRAARPGRRADAADGGPVGRSARSAAQSALAQAAALPGPGQAGGPPVHERRAVARRHVRPQADAHEVPRQARAAPTCPPSARPARPSARRSSSRSTARAASRSASSSRTPPSMIDDICVIRSMHADVPNHEPSLMLMNCGEARQARPSVGSWVLYGLGTENQNLPGFIVMCPGGFPIAESQNWQSAFLPGIYQGTYIDSKHTEIEKLIAHIRNRSRRPAGAAGPARPAGRAQPATTSTTASARPSSRPGSSRSSWPTGCSPRRPTRSTSARSPSRSARCTARACTPASSWSTRRLLERGVRFVQLWHGDGQPWDNHDDLETGHRELRQAVRPGRSPRSSRT